MNKGREIGKPLYYNAWLCLSKGNGRYFKELEGVVTEAVAKLHKKTRGLMRIATNNL